MSLSSSMCFFYFLQFSCYHQDYYYIFSLSLSPSLPHPNQTMSGFYGCYGEDLMNATGIPIKRRNVLIFVCSGYSIIIMFRDVIPQKKRAQRAYCLDSIESFYTRSCTNSTERERLAFFFFFFALIFCNLHAYY